MERYYYRYLGKEIQVIERGSHELLCVCYNLSSALLIVDALNQKEKTNEETKAKKDSNPRGDAKHRSKSNLG